MFVDKLRVGQCVGIGQKIIKITVSGAIFSLTPLVSPNDVTFKKIVFHKKSPNMAGKTIKWLTHFGKLFQRLKFRI